MKQSKLWEENNTTLMVDTAPTIHMHKNPKNLINIGYEYASEILQADRCNWQDTVNITRYGTIGFNVMYPLYVLNIVPFLRRHNIEPLKKLRTNKKIIVGGPGASNNNNLLDNIADEIFLGELDGDELDHKGWCRQSPLISKEIIHNKTAVIEIARGCKYKCAFCEYSHVLGGKYREKDISLIKTQINNCARKKIKKVTLRTANLGSYSNLDELLQYCIDKKIHMHWADITMMDTDKLIPWIKPMNITMPKMGIESFDEATRKRINKPFSDACLEQALSAIMEKCSLLHIYLIYGLPGDNYNSWFSWIHKLKAIREAQSHPVRIDFSLTNFEPCPGTPLQNTNLIDFQDKASFIKQWISTLKQAGFYKQDWDIRPGRDYGRLGRSENSYRMLMELRTAGPIITDKIINAVPSGVGRSVSKRQAEKFIQF